MYSVLFFFFNQKTAYDVRISDWSSDVCSSDLMATVFSYLGQHGGAIYPDAFDYRDAMAELIEQWRPEGQGEGTRYGRPPSTSGSAPTGRAERSTECRVRKECVSRCRSRGALYDYKKK